MMRRRRNQKKTVRGFHRVVKLVRVKTVVTAGPVYEALGAAIRNARKSAGLRQEDLSVKVGLTRASVANIEAGRQRVILDDLFVFAKALKIDARKLFEAVRPPQADRNK